MQMKHQEYVCNTEHIGRANATHVVFLGHPHGSPDTIPLRLARSALTFSHGICALSFGSSQLDIHEQKSIKPGMYVLQSLHVHPAFDGSVIGKLCKSTYVERVTAR